MPKQYYLSEKEFYEIKRDIRNGMSATQAAKIRGRSSSTASFIGRSDSFEDYKNLLFNYSRTKKKPVLKKEPVDDKPDDNRVDINKLIMAQHELIVESYHKILAIQEELKLVPKRRKW